MSYIRTFDSWADGVKQTLNPDATNAGLNVGSVAADPSALVNGDLWYQSTANELRARINGVTVSLGAGGGTPGGADTQVQFNDAGAFGGDAGFVYNKTTDALTLAGTAFLTTGTITADEPAISATQTWNNAAVTFTAIKSVITNTASNTASRLFDLQVGASSKFFVGLDGSFVSTGVEFDLGATTNANHTIKFVRPAASGINMIDFDAISGAPDLSFLRKYTASPFRMELASPTDVDIVIDANNDSTANLFRVLTNGINNAGTLVFSVSEAGDTVALGALTAGNALFNVTGTTGVLKLANGTDPAANPTNATTQWAVGGEWQYRSSAADEGAGQTNRVHNRSAEVLGAGTDYTLTTSLARVDFGTTDPEVVLPTAGTYFVMANCSFTASGLSASDVHAAILRNSTDSVFIGAPSTVSLGASFSGHVSVAATVTVTASKTIQLWAVNFTSARGVVLSAYTDIRYIRLY